MPQSFRNRPSRKPTRIPGYDYTQQGPYFVTICCEHRANRFGAVVDHDMQLNEPGEMVLRAWSELESRFPTVVLEDFVIMPNHVHGIVTLTDGGSGAVLSLSTAIGWFKTMSTNWYMHGVRTTGWPPFDGRLWQRSFHEHIIRDDADMDRIQTYVANNPALWENDTFHNP